jgi:hypothetical protein
MLSNNASLEKAKNHFEVWTPSEIEELWRLVDRGLSSRLIGERLGRSEASVFNARSRFHRELASDIYLCYLNGNGEVRTVGAPHRADAKGSQARLNRAAQELAELHPQLIFFVTTEDETSEHWREMVGWVSEGSTP